MAKTEIWGIEAWGPEIVKLWGSIRDGKGKALTAYPFEKLPEAITVTPCVLSFIMPEQIGIEVSMGAPNSVTWHGQSEFYLTADVKKASLGYIWQYIRKIVEASAKSFTLGGCVKGFYLNSGRSLEPTVLQYGDESDRFGIVAYWTVEEDLTGKVVLGA
jgi:hypothetical protein